MPGKTQKVMFSGPACPPSFIGQRVAVIGCSGSGKSTLARDIAQAKGLDYINSDELFWMPGWVQRPRPEYYAMLEQRMAGESWTFDGNFRSSAPIVLPRIDTIIWVDYSKPLVMRRLLRRTICRAWTKEEIFSGNHESWRMSFASKDSILLYAWREHGAYRQQYEALWPTLDPSITKHRIRKQKQLDALLTDAML